jgi:hypothetical protein
MCILFSFNKPYNYTINGSPVLASSADPQNFIMNFDTTGLHDVEIAVWNCPMTAPVTDTLQVMVEGQSPKVYLPIVMK